GPVPAPHRRAPRHPRALPRRRQAGRGGGQGRGREPPARRPRRRRRTHHHHTRRARGERPMTSTNGRSVTTSRRRAPLRAEAGGVPDLGADETLVLDTPVSNGHRPADAADRAAAPEVGTETILKCSGIDVSYGPVQILFGVDLEVKRGEVVALLGTNGAGKSTLLKAICGLKAPKAGTVEFKGEDITRLSADLVADKGAAL